MQSHTFVSHACAQGTPKKVKNQNFLVGAKGSRYKKADKQMESKIYIFLQLTNSTTSRHPYPCGWVGGQTTTKCYWEWRSKSRLWNYFEIKPQGSIEIIRSLEKLLLFNKLLFFSARLHSRINGLAYRPGGDSLESHNVIKWILHTIFTAKEITNE